jgi:hypothetical protein
MTHIAFGIRFTSLLLAFCLMLGTAAVQAQQLTPAQMAYLKTEIREADEAFAAEVAKIVNVRSTVVTKVLPERGRIADPVARLIAGLERSLGKPLTEQQKTAIRAADVERQKAVEDANKNALTR